MSFKTQEEPPKRKWNGREITYKQYRDSLRVQYLKYCDSLKLDTLNKNPKVSK
jgi:hypothetical protein